MPNVTALYQIEETNYDTVKNMRNGIWNSHRLQERTKRGVGTLIQINIYLMNRANSVFPAVIWNRLIKNFKFDIANS